MRFGKGNIDVERKEYGDIHLKFSCSGFNGRYEFSRYIKGVHHKEKGRNYTYDGYIEGCKVFLNMLRDTFFVAIGKRKERRIPCSKFIPSPYIERQTKSTV